jgi:hypothetical protein
LILDRIRPWRLFLAVAAAGVLVVVFGAARAEATPIVTFKCSPAPQNCSGWYRSNVSIDWEVSPSDAAVLGGCQDKTFTADTPAAGTNELCKVDDGEATVTVELKIKLDKTAPVVVGGQPGRGADVNGWYNHPVAIAFSGSDLTSGIAACTAPTYSGPDSGSASLFGTCVDNAGNVSTPFPYGLKYDDTAPEVLSASAERGPDVNGWYNHPVTFAIAGADATAGIQACPDVPYGGPDGATALLIGRCIDRAGNEATRAFGLKFDSTAPAIMDLAAAIADRSVALSWRTSPDAELVGVTRTPGFGLENTTRVFGGPGTSFVDRSVDNGVQYVYEVSVRDAAGNSGSRTITAVPLDVGAPAASDTGSGSAGGGQQAAARRRAARLIAPAAGAVVKAGRRPLLRWTPVPGASYYNVQLFRGGKILSVWTSQPQYRLKLRWRHGGRRYRLRPGEYRWIVWPGFGLRSKADYGRRIGRRGFEVAAAAR